MTQLQQRSLELDSLVAYRREVQRLDAARKTGALKQTGRWSLDQCCQHLGRWVEFSIDGFPFKYSWRFRWLGRMVSMVSWRWLVRIAMRPGFVNPPGAKAVEPDAAIAAGAGVALLLRQIDRIEGGARMTSPSPVEGPITHDQWCHFHLRHAELHLSFQHAGEK